MTHTGLPPRLCPHSVIEYDCPTPALPLCQTCGIFIERDIGRGENKKIADGMRGYWAEQQNLSANWRG